MIEFKIELISLSWCFDKTLYIVTKFLKVLQFLTQVFKARFLNNCTYPCKFLIQKSKDFVGYIWYNAFRQKQTKIKQRTMIKILTFYRLNFISLSKKIKKKEKRTSFSKLLLKWTLFLNVRCRS